MPLSHPPHKRPSVLATRSLLPVEQCAAPPTPTKPSRYGAVPLLFMLTLSALAVSVAVLFCTAHFSLLPLLPLRSRPPQPPGLTVVQLAFDVPKDQPDHAMIEHNCAVVSRSPDNHRLLVFTDDLGKPYCRKCQCLPFRKTGCECPKPEQEGCGLCEKLEFLKRQILRLGEFVFLDSDLIILKDEFLSRLYPRSRVHDMLAMYGPATKGNYFGRINSGLVFIRKVPGLNYEELTRLMWTMGANNDQNVLSEFMFKHYENWDTLSPRWHCRYLQQKDVDMPLDACYTLHSRMAFREILQRLNTTLQSV